MNKPLCLLQEIFFHNLNQGFLIRFWMSSGFEEDEESSDCYNEHPHADAPINIIQSFLSPHKILPFTVVIINAARVIKINACKIPCLSVPSENFPIIIPAN